MTKKQEQSKLNEMINASKIFAVIQSLEEALRTYKNSDTISEFRYPIQMEINALSNEIISLRKRLEYLTEESLKWEEIG